MVEQSVRDEARAIAQSAVDQQIRVCEARRENMVYRLDSIGDIVKANATAITALTSNIAALTATVAQASLQVKTNTDDLGDLADDISDLKTKPAVAAAISAAIPVLLGVLLWWFSR